MALETFPAKDSLIRPFEWLTNASSLEPILTPLLEGNKCTRVLHVGCGSSTVGQYLVQELGCALVVEADKDGPTLQKMKQRWKECRADEEQRLKFCQVDFVKDQLPYPSGYFDLVLDKSTLDCTLCSDEASAALLCQVYRSLSQHGVYVVISFHHIDMLLPLLKNLPGANWDVTHQVMRREVEDVDVTSSCNSNKPLSPDELQSVAQSTTNGASAWSTGSFEPTEEYRRTVNVVVCKRRGDGLVELDRDQVRHHIHETNDQWFQFQNPMLTGIRQDELQQAFTEESFVLPTCYKVLFTDAEREHLTYEYFLQDWNAFLETRPNLSRDSMTFETAIAFLKEMQ